MFLYSGRLLDDNKYFKQKDLLLKMLDYYNDTVPLVKWNDEYRTDPTLNYQKITDESNLRKMWVNSGKGISDDYKSYMTFNGINIVSCGFSCYNFNFSVYLELWNYVPMASYINDKKYYTWASQQPERLSFSLENDTFEDFCAGIELMKECQLQNEKKMKLFKASQKELKLNSDFE